MKRKFFYLIFALPIILYNCSNEDAVNEKHVATTAVTPDGAKMQTVAKLLSGLTTNQEIATEVRAGVERSLTYGLDEELRFTDILQPKRSRLGENNLLAESVKNLLDDHNATNGLRSSGNDLEAFLLNENVQIYWPYSENWDGEETPVITFDPGTENADKVIAYKIIKLPDGTTGVDSLIVDEAYAMKHPVWVINKNDVDYEDLPDFANEEYEKNGVLFHSKLSQEKMDNVLRSSSSPSGYEFRLGTVQATKHHDDWVNGGSEFEFKCTFPLAPSYSTSGSTTIRKDIARKHINSNGTVFPINMPLNTNWREDQIHNGVKIIESDGGGVNYCEFDLDVSILGKQVEVKGKIPYGSSDDELYENVLERIYITSDNNFDASGNPRIHESAGLRWTMYIDPYDNY
ncbi:MAG: hypothetical protein LBF08_01035 [Dysgonamonadaceae bacterium]|jgi:hypothetical protein|nr:hypothetical protein [Dysgonamonadaceae bacterium]